MRAGSEPQGHAQESMEKETPDSEHGQAAQMVHLKRMKTSVAIKDKKKPARGRRKSESREEALIE